MSLLRGKNKLVCFYCNKKSGIVYDGLITQWECAKCDAHNYLDEQGEITDPPVATEHVASSKSTYAISKPDFDFLSPSPPSNTFIFCSTCQKNQHLYRASLAQYHVETDPYHPEYRRLEKEYFRYRKDLEKRYPQVCEECAPKALEQMRVAKRTAQSDWLKRQLEKSQALNFMPRPGTISFINLYKLLWFAGVFGHLIWNATNLIAAILQNTEIISNLNIPPTLVNLLERLVTLAISDKWVWRSLKCSFFAFGWNPRFKEVIAHNNRLHTLIKGYRHWYKFQLIMILTRYFMYYIMRKSVFAAPFGPAAIGAHIFSFSFVTLLSIRSRKTLKVDHSPLWRHDQDFGIIGPALGPRTQTIPGDGTLEDILNEISSLPEKPPPRNSSQMKTVSPTWDGSTNDVSSPKAQFPKNSHYSPTYDTHSSSRSSIMMTPRESAQHLETGILPERLQIHEEDPNEMDWIPMVPQTQHRAFNTPQSLRPGYQSQLFNHTPASEKSPVFWAKVPPAPITPAHKLRNPPNQPRLRATSQEKKDNFFNSMTRRNPGQQETAPNETVDSRREIQISQQKFFAPSPPSEEADALARAFGGFTLSDAAPQQQARQIPIGSLLSLVLIAGLLYMAFVYERPSSGVVAGL